MDAFEKIESFERDLVSLEVRKDTQRISELLSDESQELGSSGGMIRNATETVQLPNLVLTHFSPRYQLNPHASPSIEDIRKEVENAYIGSLYLARYFCEYILDKAGHFFEVASE